MYMGGKNTLNYTIAHLNVSVRSIFHQQKALLRIH